MAKLGSKKERALRLLKANLAAFRCPICQGELFSNDVSGLHCAQRHTFDLARNGYLNLLVGPQNTHYDRALFNSRRQVFSSGIYDPLIEKTASFIENLGFEDPLILDAGCGEGSFLARLAKRVVGRQIGIDISKEGIRLAAAQDEKILWCVADLASLPLASSCVAVILNILSPANYGEFQRVLKPGGVVVKVLPGANYLREIRERLPHGKEYSNQEVLAHLEGNMEVQRSEHLQYEVPVNPNLWQDLVTMTPLSRYRAVRGEPPLSLTIDLQVVQGILPNS